MEINRDTGSKVPQGRRPYSAGRSRVAPTSRSMDRFGDYFTWPAVRLFALVYLVGISNGHVMTLVLLGLLAWAATGVTQAIMAMTFVAMFRFSNPAVASFSSLGTVLFWLITMVASARLYASARHLTLPVRLLVAFSITAILLSVAVSRAPDVSAMKVISFFIVGSALLLAAGTRTERDVAKLQRWFFSVALTIAVLSLLTAPFPSIGFAFLPGSLQGMFNHPQDAGVFYVPFAAWFVTQIFLQPIRTLPRWLPLIAIVFCGLIVASSARTAMLATFLSVGVSLAIVIARGNSGPGMRSRGQIVGITLAMGLLSVGLVASGALTEELQSLVFKDDAGVAQGEVGAAFAHSRGAGMMDQLANFRDAPLTGHGFGVYRDGVRGGEESVRRFMGIPISAPAEKGVVFTAVLEETGVIGGLLFYSLLISIVAAAARGRDAKVAAMAIGCILVNFGEAIIFSAGGMGLFMWLIIGFALARSRVEPNLRMAVEVSSQKRSQGRRLD